MEQVKAQDLYLLFCKVRILLQKEKQSYLLELGKKQTHGPREQTCGYEEGGGRKWDGLGVWDWQIQTITFRMDKQ